MIQYDITSKHFRVGWIKENALPGKAEVKDLLFSDEQFYTTAQCSLTDDPLASKAEIDRIAPGVKVSRLALMGEWSYVESGYGSSPIRGFIESEKLTKLSVGQVEWLAQTEAQNVVSRKEMGEESSLIYVKETKYRPESGKWEVKIESGEGKYMVIVDDITGEAMMEGKTSSGNRFVKQKRAARIKRAAQWKLIVQFQEPLITPIVAFAVTDRTGT